MTSKHTDHEYEGELAHLREMIEVMGTAASEMVVSGLRAFQEANRDLARETIDRDDEVDRLELAIDDLCLHILARRQPVASDLRLVATALKLVTDLERIGDLSVNISKRAVELADEPALMPTKGLFEMAEIAQGMVHEAVEAYLGADAERAEAVLLQDRTVDVHYAEVFRELLASIMQDVSNTQWATRAQGVARSIERIGDHAANVAEMVVFMVKGKDIRHRAGLARSAGDAGPKGMLFLCVHNAARSQMAEGWARAILPYTVAIYSAGSAPASTVDPKATRVMREVGIDISQQRPKRISEVPLGEIDTIITLCVEEICVAIPGTVRSETWALPDPAAATDSEEQVLGTFRQVRDDLRQRIERFRPADALPGAP